MQVLEVDDIVDNCLWFRAKVLDNFEGFLVHGLVQVSCARKDEISGGVE